MLTVRPVRITDLADALMPLFEAHRQELATHPDLMRLGLRLDVYKHLEDQRSLLSLVLEDGDGIVGYSVNIISNNLHYGDLKTCQNDVIYVQPGYRERGGGKTLLDATEERARQAGCEMVLWHAKPGTRLVDVLEARGCTVQDVIYSKVL